MRNKQDGYLADGHSIRTGNVFPRLFLLRSPVCSGAGVGFESSVSQFYRG